MSTKKNYLHTERVVRGGKYPRIQDMDFSSEGPMLSKGMMMNWIQQLDLMVFMLPTVEKTRFGDLSKSFWLLDQHGKLWVYGKGVYSRRLNYFIPEGEYGYHDKSSPQNYAGCRFNVSTTNTIQGGIDTQLGPGFPVSPYLDFDNAQNKPWMWSDEEGFEYPVELTESQKEKLSQRLHVIGYGVRLEKFIDNNECILFNGNPHFYSNSRGMFSLTHPVEGGRLKMEYLSGLKFIYPDHGYRGDTSIAQPYSFDPYFMPGWDRQVGCYYNAGFYPTIKTLAKGGYHSYILLGGTYGYNMTDTSTLVTHGIKLYSGTLKYLNNTSLLYQQPTNKKEQDAYPSRYYPIDVYRDETDSINPYYININSWLGDKYHLFEHGSNILTSSPIDNLMDYRYRKPTTPYERLTTIYSGSIAPPYLVLKSHLVRFSDKVKLKQAINCNDVHQRVIEHQIFNWSYPNNRNYPTLPPTAFIQNVSKSDGGLNVVKHSREWEYFPYINDFETKFHLMLKPNEGHQSLPYFGQHRTDVLFTTSYMNFTRFPEIFENVEDYENLAKWYSKEGGAISSTTTKYHTPTLDDGNVLENIVTYPITFAPFVGENAEGYFPAIVDNWGPVERKINVPTVTLDTVRHRYFKMREKPFYGNRITVNDLAPLSSQLTHFIGGGFLTKDINLDVMGNLIPLRCGDIIYPESIYPVHLRGDHHYPVEHEKVEHPRMGYQDHIWYHHQRSYIKNNTMMKQFYPLICINDGRLEGGQVKGDVLMYNWQDNEYYRVRENTHLSVLDGPDGANFLGLTEEQRQRVFSPENKITPLLFTVKKRLSRYHFPLRAKFPDGTWVRHDASLFRVWMEFYWDKVTVKTLETLDMAENFLVESYFSDTKPVPHYVNHATGDGYTLRLPWEKDSVMIIGSIGHYLHFVPKNEKQDIIWRHSEYTNGYQFYRVDIPFIAPHPAYEEGIQDRHRFKENDGGVFQCFNHPTRTSRKATGYTESKTKIYHGRKFDYIDNFGQMPLLPARTAMNYVHQDRLPVNATYDWVEGVYKVEGQAISEMGIRLHGQLQWIVDIGPWRQYTDAKGKIVDITNVVDDGIGIEYGYIDYDKGKKNVRHHYMKQYTFESLKNELNKFPTVNMTSNAVLISSELFGEAYTPYFKLDKLIWRHNNHSRNIFMKDEASYFFSRAEGLPDGQTHHRVFYIDVPVMIRRGWDDERIERQRFTFTLNFKIKFKLSAVKTYDHPMNLGFLHDPTRFAMYFSTPSDPYSDFKDREEFKSLVLDKMNVSYNGHNHTEVVDGLGYRSSLGEMDAVARGLEPHTTNITREYNVNAGDDVSEDERNGYHLRINTTIPVRTARVNWPTVYAANRTKRVVERQSDYQIASHIPAVGSKYWHRSFLLRINRNNRDPKYMNMFEQNLVKEDPRNSQPEGNALIYGESEMVKTGLDVRHRSTLNSSLEFNLTDCLDIRVAQELVTLNVRFELSSRQGNEILCFRTNAMNYYQMLDMTHEKSLGIIQYNGTNNDANNLATLLTLYRSPFVWAKLNELIFVRGNVNSKLLTERLKTGFLREGEKPMMGGKYLYNLSDGSQREPEKILDTGSLADLEISEEEYDKHWNSSLPSPGTGIKRALKVQAWLSAKPLTSDNPLYSWREVQNSISFNQWGEGNKLVKYFKCMDN